ncbi:ABC transporter substrate-binding protein [Sporanaerobium hydrogeniformans]|uniref:ABC transporter substrate-binding protein n=1 Tax=Sporanaerobium hydrogeniformans TaxID=3072179 RepID=A0AC61D807_9FIRM|nr:extracellular solute-binding protein [Sporanaerobium hydrogeniformans]PHV69348.1 ABC transporter substrate-binding protein [Sporanaerobium hydrogeniformans]
MGRRLMKGVALVLGLGMVMGTIGCGGTTAQPEAKTSEPKQAAAANKENKTDEAVTLNFWHIWGAETDASYNAVKTVIADFEKEYPNIKIKVDTTENEAYKTKIKAAAAANELPDVFSTWGGGFSKPFIEAGRVLAIDEYLEDGTKDRMVGGALANVTYGDKVYGMTFGLSCGAFFMNEELFKANNIKIPETYDELITAVKAFKAVGITPMAVSGKDTWTIAMYFDAMALKAAGNDTIVKTLNKEGSFQDPAFLSAATKFAELVSLGAFPAGAAGLSKDESDIDFLEGKIPMLFNGSWTAGTVYREDSKIKDKVIVRGFPVFGDGKGNKNEFTGGAVDAIMVNADTKHKEAAVLFQKYFCENMARETYLAGAYLPAWKVDVDETNINPLTVQLAELTSQAEGFTLWWDTLLEGNDTQIYLNALQELLLGSITPEEYIAKLETIYQK